MRKRNCFFLFCAILALDLSIKSIFIHFNIFKFFGPIGFGAFIGERNITAFVSEYPDAIKFVVLDTVIAFLMLLYFVLALLITVRLGRLLMALTLILVGFVSNAVDCALHTGVTSIFLIGPPENIFYHCNLADLSIFAGIILLFYALYRDREIIWPRTTYKRTYWINPEFQTRYSLILCGLGLAFAIIQGVFTYSFINAILYLSQESQEPVGEAPLFLFAMCFIIITSLYLTVLLIFARRLTHRVAGPVYAFEKCVDDIINGKEARMRLREGDEFPQLSRILERIAQLRK